MNHILAAAFISDNETMEMFIFTLIKTFTSSYYSNSTL